MPFERLTSLLVSAAPALARTPGFARFYASRDDDEARLLGRLYAVVEALEAYDGATAATLATGVLGDVRDDAPEDAPRGGPGRVVLAFAEALLARAAPDHRHRRGGGNLYFDARPEGVQLRAFELLRRNTPLIAFGYAAANEAILEAIGARDGAAPKDLVVVDIGIGRGSQYRALLEGVRGRNVLRSIRVVGVDGGPLETARRVVLDWAADVGVPATFDGLPMLAEELTAAELSDVSRRGCAGEQTPFVATAAFALHHVVDVGDHTLAARDGVLRTLRAAGARHVVLVEPDSNHFENDLSLRFLHAYRHYRTVSAALARSLSASDAHVVWSEFFAPEVCNVITHDGLHRVERHEELTRWAERATAAGFRIDDLREVAARVAAPEGFEVHADASGLRLYFEGVSLLGVLRASI